MAKLPSSRVSHYRVQNFSGGLNTNTEPSLLEDNEASDLLNVTFDVKGLVKKRPAVRITEDLGIGVEKIYTIYDFHRKDNSFERIYFYREAILDPDSGMTIPNRDNRVFSRLNATGEKNLLFFYKEDGITTYDFDETVSSTSTEYTNSKQVKWCFFTFNDKMYMTNPKDGLFVYSGHEKGFKIIETPKGTPDTTDELGVVTPGTHHNFIQPCKYAIVHKNRVFYTGFSKESDKLMFSELGKPEGVKQEVADEFGKTQDTGGGFIFIPSNDTEITGLGTFLDKLVIFKLNSAYTLSGAKPVEFDLGRINVNDGCVSHDSIVLGNNFLYFLSPTGLNYLYSPDQQMIETNSLSNKIEDILLKENLAESFAVFYRAKYYLFTENFLYVYDETLKAWAKHDVKMRAALVDKENKYILLLNPRYKLDTALWLPYVYTFDETKLNDEYELGQELAIKCVYQTRYFDFGEPELQKRLKFIKLFFLPTNDEGEIRLIQEINYRSQTRFVDTTYNAMFWGVQDWGEGYWGAKVDFLSKKIAVGGIGEYVRYSFINDKLDQEFKIYSFIVGFKRKQKVR